MSDATGEDAALRDSVITALWEHDEGLGWNMSVETRADYESASHAVLKAIPDGWAKVDGEWFRITSDGVGYGEFDRDTSAPRDIEAPSDPGSRGGAE